MGNHRFVILAINSSDEGIRALLRCTRCGEPSGFDFQSEVFRGRYPILCQCGAEVLLDISRPVEGCALIEELEEAFPWAPVIERRLWPKPN
jgi:hypothetical protein